MAVTRWNKLIHHQVQQDYARSTARFNVLWAGRRSGKTDIAKRRLITRALTFNGHSDGYFIMGAPTRDQAKRIFWSDLKRMVPPELRIGDPREVELTIHLVNGARIACIGMDKPERHEGTPIDGGVLDEYGNMKPEVWSKHLRPALDTMGRLGWMDFIGVPEGRNHFYNLARKAQADTTGQYAAHHWKSSLILGEEQISAARADLDELTFNQEYNADFVSFQGQAYYPFDEKVHAAHALSYNPNSPLHICLDFNRSPGTGNVVQEFDNLLNWEGVGARYTGVIGEVHVPTNSNTKIVAERLADDWGHHRGEVQLHGDATGGMPGSAKIAGSDWDIVESVLRPVFKDRLVHCYRRSNPLERVRVNAFNSRLQSMDGVVHLLIDRGKAPELLRDMEGVRVIQGGSGQLDKNYDASLTHHSDGVGYYIAERHPIGGSSGIAVEEFV